MSMSMRMIGRYLHFQTGSDGKSRARLRESPVDFAEALH